MAKRNRNGVRKERVIMLASSVLVLTALTVTGIFVKGNNKAEKEDYVVDFEEIEKETDSVDQMAGVAMPGEDLDALFAEVGTDDLDYDPSFQEANSGNVENTEAEENVSETGQKTKTTITIKKDDAEKVESENKEKKEADKKKETKETKETKTESSKKEEEGMFDETVDTAKRPEDTEALSTTVQPALDFNEEDGLVWPIVGDVLINYSMDKTIFFPTLQQYKYNPAIVISAPQGENIAAAADGKVTSVAFDPFIGNTVVMDLGNGYELTYGQLENITVSEGSYVATGDIIGTVASPTKFYSTEGSNVYFKLLKDGEPINPMSKLN